MADPPPDVVVQAVDWSDVAYQLTNGALKRSAEAKAGESIAGTLAEGLVGGLHAVLKAFVPIATLLGKGLVELEEPLQPVIAGFVGPVIRGLFGAQIDDAALTRRLSSGEAGAAAKSIVDGFMRAIMGDSGAEIAPGDEGAMRLANAAVAASLESMILATIPELLSDMLGEFGPRLTALTELPEEIIRILGVSRLLRRALTPYVNATCATPALWSVNKKYRPTLLGVSTLARQILRDPANADAWREELRRLGYSDARIAALLNEARHFFSPSDVRALEYRGAWDQATALQHLRDQGYTEKDATDALRLEGLRRIQALEDAEANAIIAAYVAGDIDKATLGAMLQTAVSVEVERTLRTEEAETRRAANVTHLSLSQVAAMVKSGVLSLADYRATAERLNYDADAVTALDLQLRWEMNQAAKIADLKAEQAKERAAAQAQRDADRQKKLAEIAAQRALDRRGSEADLEAAAVRGLIPLARVEEVYAQKYDEDTAAILMETLTAKRQDYLDAQQKAADAAKRAAVKNIDVGSLQQAVLTHVLTLNEFTTRLGQLGFPAADAAILTSTLAARLQALSDAQAKRDAAAAAAKVKSIDLGRFETLVRRGHRTIAEYQALLASLGYDEGSIAAMVELLQLKIDDDARAAQLRAAKAAAADKRGLTLDDMRRAVILGITPIAAYTPFLLQLGYSTDDAAVLVRELQADVDEAAAARARRKAADARLQAPRAPLADVRRAAQLGLIPVPVYVDRMKADGYTDDDVAIELDLLTAEIAKTKADEAAAAARDAASGQKGLTLAQLAAAVLAGTAPIGQYTARALAIGLSADDAATLTATLQAQLDATAAARARKAQLAAEGADRELARADVEKAVRGGLKTLDDYDAWLQSAGYASDDAALLVAELQAAIGGGGGTSGTGTGA